MTSQERIERALKNKLPTHDELMSRICKIDRSGWENRHYDGYGNLVMITGKTPPIPYEGFVSWKYD